MRFHRGQPPRLQLDALRLVIPPELFARRGADARAARSARDHLAPHRVYVLDTVSSHVSATEVRQRLDRNQSIHGLVPPRVEEYISKKALYR